MTNPGINALILIFPLNSFDRLLVNPNKPALDAAYTEVPGIKCSVIDNTEEIFNIVGSDPFGEAYSSPPFDLVVWEPLDLN